MPSARRVTSPADLTPAVFSTAGLAAPRRVELWEAHNATALIGLDVHAPGPLNATEINVQLPRTRLARVTASAHAVERTKDVIARCPADSIAIYLALRGDASFTSADGTYRLRPGEAVVYATDQAFARRFAGGLEELVATVPCSALPGYLDVTLAKPKISLFSASGRRASRQAGGAAPVATAEVSQYARALARLVGRATRTKQPLTPDERTRPPPPGACPGVTSHFRHPVALLLARPSGTGNNLPHRPPTRERRKGARPCLPSMMDSPRPSCRRTPPSRPTCSSSGPARPAARPR